MTPSDSARDPSASIASAEDERRFARPHIGPVTRCDFERTIIPIVAKLDS